MNKYDLMVLQRHMKNVVRKGEEHLKHKERLEAIDGGKEIYDQMVEDLEMAKGVLARIEAKLKEP